MLRVLWIVAVTLQAGLLIRLTLSRLVSLFPLFFSWILFDTCIQVLRLLSYELHSYWKTWAITEPLLVMLSLLAGSEIYVRGLKGVPDSNRAKWKWLGLFMLAATIGAMVFQARPWSGLDWRQGELLRAKRVSLTFLFLCLVLFKLFAGRFGSPSRNIIMHSRIMLMYLGTWALVLWLMVWGGRTWVTALNPVLMWAWCGCLVAWLVLLRREPATASAPWSVEEAERLRRERQELLEATRPPK